MRCGDDVRCAKVYKEASQRSFRQATEYQEGRKVKNSRRARAMEKNSRYGKREEKRGMKYDGIILDPPKFGRGPKGEVWEVYKSLPSLLDMCRA